MNDSQFVVSRTARKDNSSDYYVDGKKKPFKEVAQLLRNCGIDLDHNRFLILQVRILRLFLKSNVRSVKTKFCKLREVVEGLLINCKLHHDREIMDIMSPGASP